eukprot:TRINITY_DN112319_c0_g1_i1.p1 TRINITY_DN112319_c0_g1~~TRINITY_DN112319_c0_g1_i1.p1  ORF type:complete len:591 (-),score=66.92 TRINITY_DN112319_c0_g1_i1:110-1858(-)
MPRTTAEVEVSQAHAPHPHRHVGGGQRPATCGGPVGRFSHWQTHQQPSQATKNSTLAVQLVSLNKYNTTLKQQVNRLNLEKEQLNKELAQVKCQKSTENPTTKRESDMLKRQLEALRSEVATLRNANAKLLDEREDRQTRAPPADVEKMRKELQSSREEMLKLRTSNRQCEELLAQTKKDLLQTQRAQASWNQSCQELRNSLAEREQSFKEKEKQLLHMDRLIQESEASRKHLHNSLQELKGNIRVYCRVRPVLPHENETEPIFAVKPDDCTLDIRNPDPNKRTKSTFTFDRVFGTASTQDDVFDEVSQLVQSALDGYKVCIFAYGQTGSGKTYTMEGSPHECGVIPRTIDQIFSAKKDFTSTGWEFTLEASFLEIYNETIRDLLADPDCNHDYTIHQDPATGSTYVSNLTQKEVVTPEEVHQLLEVASRNRKVACTKMNDRSSRSHSVFTLRLTGSHSVRNIKSRGIIQLIDLAGSERVKDSKVEGDQLREAQHINKSLSSLGDVIVALGKKKGHVPFRNSKLTYLLQSCLGGSSKCLMFVNTSPLATHFSETMCSLNFAAKVSQCDNGRAKRNLDLLNNP